MPVTVLSCADYQQMAWKNGAGSTLEVAAAPVGSGLPDFYWRVSIADVEAEGPFSLFPGVDRVLTLVDGPSMVLAVDSTDYRLTPATPFAFPGESTVSCRLPAGPIRGINVMTRRGRAAASVTVLDVEAHRDITVHPGEILLTFALSGQLALSVSELAPVALERLDAVCLGEPGSIRMQGSGTIAEIRIEAAGGACAG